MGSYQVWRQRKTGGFWPVIGSEGNKSYALGWYHALTSFIPRPAYKITDQDGRILEADEAHEGVHTN